MNEDMDAQFLCKDCARYNLCEYYHRRKKDSYICKYFHLSETYGMPNEQEPKTGHWIEVAKYSDGMHEIKCSECESHIFDRGHANSYVVKEKYKYCPNCGAKMVKPQESEDKE